MSGGKLVIFSAPSGAGKTTIVRHLLSLGLNFGFSISATTRKPRGAEQNGKEYYFLSAEEFKEKVDRDEFLEWEEVYSNCFYGTLKTEVDLATSIGKNVIFDVDVKGGLNIKKIYGVEALSVFIMPPSIEELEKRLRLRSTEDSESFTKRVKKANLEISYSSGFDKIVVNDDLEKAKTEVSKVVREFLNIT